MITFVHPDEGDEMVDADVTENYRAGTHPRSGTHGWCGTLASKQALATSLPHSVAEQLWKAASIEVLLHIVAQRSWHVGPGGSVLR